MKMKFLDKFEISLPNSLLMTALHSFIVYSLMRDLFIYSNNSSTESLAMIWLGLILAFSQFVSAIN